MNGMIFIPREKKEAVDFCQMIVHLARSPEWSQLVDKFNKVMDDNNRFLQEQARNEKIPFDQLARNTIEVATRNETLRQIVDLPLRAYRSLQKLNQLEKALEDAKTKK